MSPSIHRRKVQRQLSLTFEAIARPAFLQHNSMMKTLTTLLAVTSLAFITTAAPSRGLVQGSCGVCDTFPNGAIGGSAQIPLRSSTDHDKDRAYKCTTFDQLVRLNTCVNLQCDLCMIFK
jgi:hypothetical protein